MKQPKRASRHHSSRWSRVFSASVHHPFSASLAAVTSRGLPLPASISSCARAASGENAIAAAATSGIHFRRLNRLVILLLCNRFLQSSLCYYLLQRTRIV